MAKPGGPTPLKRSSRPGVRIESDGTVTGSRVFIEDTDVEVRYVQAVDVRFEAGELPAATLHVLKVAGRINAEVEAIKETLVPEPSRVLTVTVSQALVGDRSKIVVTRKTNRGTDHTLVETVCEGWVSACEPFELTVPEEGT